LWKRCDISIKIAYLGPPGSYSEQAVKKWDNEAELIPVDSIHAVATYVSNNNLAFGMVPIENSIEGGVTSTLDLLIHDFDLSIMGESILAIKHCLMAKSDLNMTEIERIFSHPQSLGQCRNFLNTELPSAELVASLSNSRAVEEMMNEEDFSVAAIASERAADLYGAKILKKDIQDTLNNETRFVILSHSDHLPTGNDKTSLCFEYGEDSPGILSESLREFASRNINLVKIESRPNKVDLGKYVFFVDIKGHKTDPKVVEALNVLESQVSKMKILGSYPNQSQS
jgi:prephenate dehydratase